jgi:molybdopterin molybdotransferase
VQVCDDIDALIQTFELASSISDIIISTGGVSVGQMDLVPEALEKLGAEIIYHGVSLKPGMPVVFAILNGKPVLALSGNPFACAVTFELLARPALAVLASDKRIEAHRNKAVLADSCEKKRLVPRFYRGIFIDGRVTIPCEQGNGQIRTMIGCNCLVELPVGNAPLPAGTSVNVYMLEGEIYGI